MRLTADPDLAFSTTARRWTAEPHQAWTVTRDAVLMAVAAGRSVGVLGASGTGKSLLLADLAATLAARGQAATLVKHTGMGVPPDPGVLLIDEADGLSPGSLAGFLRRAPVCVLAGLPSLARTLADVAPGLTIVSLEPLWPSDVTNFVRAHLARTGAAVTTVDPAGLEALMAQSGCVPRTLQILAGLASFAAGMEEAGLISRRHVDTAVRLRFGSAEGLADQADDEAADALAGTLPGAAVPDRAAAVHGNARSDGTRREGASRDIDGLDRASVDDASADKASFARSADDQPENAGTDGTAAPPVVAAQPVSSLAVDRPSPPWGPSRGAAIPGRGGPSRPAAQPAVRSGRVRSLLVIAGAVAVAALILSPPGMRRWGLPGIAVLSGPEPLAPEAMPAAQTPLQPGPAAGLSAVPPPAVPAPQPMRVIATVAPPARPAVPPLAVILPSVAPTPAPDPVAAPDADPAPASAPSTGQSPAAPGAAAPGPDADAFGRLPAGARPRVTVTYVGQDGALARRVSARLANQGFTVTPPRPRVAGSPGTLYFFAEDAAAARAVTDAAAVAGTNPRPSQRPIRISDTPPGSVELALPAPLAPLPVKGDPNDR